MKSESEKLTWRKAWKMNLRAWSIWWKLRPSVFLSALASSVMKAVTPYVTIYLSARILDELAGSRRPDELFRWVVLTLACTAACTLLQSLAARWSSCEMSSTYPEEEHIYIKKMTRLDYADMDRQAVHDLYSQILQNKNWSSWGIRKTLYYFEELVGAAAQILGGAGLSVSLFLLKVPQESGFAFVNHPLIAAAMLALMLL